MAPYILMLCLAAAVCGHTEAQVKTHGKASWYHDKLHGRRMANGKPYHRDSMTCAHLKFPLGTQLLVTNLRTKEQVVVRVTDRGPYSRKFVIDLSRRAARELGILTDPNADVELQPVGKGCIVPFRPIDTDTVTFSLPLIEMIDDSTSFSDIIQDTRDNPTTPANINKQQ